MTRDIVERLRAATPYGLEDAFVLRDAVLEIERLRTVIYRIQSALETAEGEK